MIVRRPSSTYLAWQLIRDVAQRAEWEDCLINGFPWDAPLETETDFVYPNEESGVNIFSV